jgi:MraZ protein
MQDLTGEFNVTLDEKGRISLPASLRKCLDDSTLHLTKGSDDCLWLYPNSQWNEIRNIIMKNTDQFSEEGLKLRRRILGPKQPVDIDKAGRISIPISLREFSSLSKDCVVLGQVDYIEIWAEERYRKFITYSSDDYKAAAKELSNTLKKQRESND